MSYGVKIDNKNLKRKEYGSYTRPNKKLYSDRYSGAKKEKVEVTNQKKVPNSSTVKKDNLYLKPYSIKTTNPKDLDLNKPTSDESKNDPKVILLSIIVIIFGIIVGILVLLLKMFD